MLNQVIAIYIAMQYIFMKKRFSLFDKNQRCYKPVVAPKMADFLSKDLLNVPICMHERQLYTGTELIVLDRENTSEARESYSVDHTSREMLIENSQAL